jgi:hypothetical protein
MDTSLNNSLLSHGGRLGVTETWETGNGVGGGDRQTDPYRRARAMAAADLRTCMMERFGDLGFSSHCSGRGRSELRSTGLKQWLEVAD